MDNEELTYLMALTSLHYNHIRKTRIVLDHYGNAQEAWKHEGEGANAALMRARKELDFIHQHQIQVYDYRSASFPERLRQCPDAPVLLYGKGNIRTNEGKFVSIVGTRSATERGKDLTRRLVLDLADRLSDITIVSGLAYGIDVAAHRAALEAGIPTIIIPAHGLDRIYPLLHRSVAVEALERGGILTEYMTGTEPEKLNFVARNRIVAGMADAVVVVESKQRGGSLITAQMACDYDRSLFAFPGRPQDLQSNGCNDLIRTQKAELIESADHLIEFMQWGEETAPPKQTTIDYGWEDMSEEERKLLEVLKSDADGVHINSLVMETNMPYSQAAATLMTLEMKDRVTSLPGGMYRLRV